MLHFTDQQVAVYSEHTHYLTPQVHLLVDQEEGSYSVLNKESMGSNKTTVGWSLFSKEDTVTRLRQSKCD